jgi:CheY-like chemotaxis protein
MVATFSRDEIDSFFQRSWEHVMTRILIVEDDIAIQEMLTAVLEPEGYDVAIASDGARALNVANDMTPDLIIMDLLLPRLNGIDAIQQLREKPAFATLPIIAMSAVPPLLYAAEQCGATARVEKPFDIVDMLGLIETSLNNDG